MDLLNIFSKRSNSDAFFMSDIIIIKILYVYLKKIIMERLTAQEARDIYLQNLELDDKDNKEIDNVMETIHKCLKNGMLRCVIHNDLRNETKKWLLGNGYRLEIDHAHHDESGVWHPTEVTIAWGLLN